MNRIQEIEFEILKVFISVCEQLKIKYYLVCGSALGAAKYQGFIPWDDDMDVALLRKDYERFLKEAPYLIPEWLFIQNYHTDPSFPHIYTKLRNSNTTLIEQGTRNLPIHQGIGIDVFPLDGHPKGKIARNTFELRKKLMLWLACCALEDGSNWKVRLRNPILRMLGFHRCTNRILARVERMYSKYSTDESELWCNYGNWQGRLEYASRSQYGAGIHAVFEGLNVVIPEKYDEYLTQKYGDWRADPPKDMQKSHHNIVICDPDHPYTDHIRI